MKSRLRSRGALGALLATATIIGLGAAGTGAAQAADPGARLPDSVLLSAYYNAADYSSITEPQVVCPPSEANGCVVESAGTTQSVRIGMFAVSTANVRLAELHGSISATRFVTYDASGRQVDTVPGLSCDSVPWVSGRYILCANTTPGFRVAIPAGGRLAPAAGTGAFGVFNNQTTSPWPIGHDFADKNHPQTTVYDRAIVRAQAFGAFTTGGPNAYTYDTTKVPAGATASVAQEEDIYFGTTATTLTVNGLVPNRTYGAHVHTNACGPNPTDAGGHYQNAPSADPSAANPNNEIWLDFTTDANGNASISSHSSWIARAGQGESVVIHDLATAPGGVAGARLACLALGK